MRCVRMLAATLLSLPGFFDRMVAETNAYIAEITP